MRVFKMIIAAVFAVSLPTAAMAQGIDPSQILSVSCNRAFDPPVIDIILLNSQGFTLSTAIYQNLLDMGFRFAESLRLIHRLTIAGRCFAVAYFYRRL